MQGFIYNVMGTLKLITIADIIDIAIVSFIIYKLIKLIRETRAAQLMKGIVALIVVYSLLEILAFLSILDLKTIRFIMSSIFKIGILAVIIVFQPELRRALEQVGRTRLSKISELFLPTPGSDEHDIILIRTMIRSLGEACSSFSRQKVGALIVLERITRLGEIIKTGTIINSEPSTELIENIFFKNSPLHDGALIIRSGRLYAAGCLLPLSDNHQIAREMGTRHRAALGMSEVSDAITVVVSEETGGISVAVDGHLSRDYTVEKLVEELESLLIPADNEQKPDKWTSFRRNKK